MEWSPSQYSRVLVQSNFLSMSNCSRNIPKGINESDEFEALDSGIDLDGDVSFAKYQHWVVFSLLKHVIGNCCYYIYQNVSNQLPPEKIPK